MQLKFEKWHGCRNDFIVLWLSDNQGQLVLDSLLRQAPRLCSRQGDGIAADGIIVLHIKHEKEVAPTKLTVINADGSLAKNCGNGLRCAALSVLKRQQEIGNIKETLELVEFNLVERLYNCRFMAAKHKGWPLVSVDMGIPLINESLPNFTEMLTESGLKNLTEFNFCRVGNDHVVFMVEEDALEMLKIIGPRLQKLKVWDGINVSFATLGGDENPDIPSVFGRERGEVFQAWTWERGVGMTEACGSAATAVGVVAYKLSSTPYGKWVGVNMPGGNLFVRQDGVNEPVSLVGPGELVFLGTVEI